MRNRVPLVLWILALFATTGFSRVDAQAISQILFLPQTYYVGDVVEARVVIRTSGNLDLSSPSALPESEWVDIHSVTIVQRADGYEARIVFQPFFVGTRRLPELDLGAMTLDGVSVVVNSLRLDEGPFELQPVRDQILLPGTEFLLAGIVVALVGTPLLFILTGGWLRHRIQWLRTRYRENRPYRMLQKGLRQLQNEMHEMDGKRYYIRLLDLLRGYLEGRVAPVFRSATTGEMDVILRRYNVHEGERSRIVALFQFGDLVKFANRRISVDDRTRHLEELRGIAAELQRRDRRGEEDSRVGA